MAFTRRRRFGRRRFGLKRKGNYELLFTPFASGNDPPARNFTIQNLGDPTNASLAIQATSPAANQPEEPPFPAGGAFGTTQTVRVDENLGFTTLIPLWDTQLANEYDHDVLLKSLRGFLVPTSLVLKQAEDPVATTVRFRIRLEILPIEVSEEEALLGGPATRATLPFISFSRAANRRRIWWRREWFVPANSALPFQFWNAAGGNGEALSYDPKLSPTLGSYEVRLRNLMRIKRERWPVLAISVQGNWPNGFTQNVVSGGLLEGIANGNECTVGITGELRAYLQR